jgi:prepilin-type N-terminal cleavage/methylation domain-containing protein
MKSRKGFSLIEVIIVMGVGAVLAAMTVMSFGSVRGSMTVNAAKGTFQTMHAATRAIAVERGMLMRLVADPADATVSIEEGCGGGGTVVQTETLPANIDTGGGIFAICMTPRGYADPAGNSFVNEGTIAFTQGSHSVELRFLPLGQAIAQ